MAAPALAGAAAVLRQYFAEGYCSSSDDDNGSARGTCCGYRGCGRSVDPSGSLMKAVLMNGARPLRGGVQYVPGGDVLEDQPLAEYDSNQGMGRVNLLESVPLRGRNEMRMMVVNDKWIGDGERDVYKVFVDRSDGCDRELSATLAWYGEFSFLRGLVENTERDREEDAFVSWVSKGRRRQVVRFAGLASSRLRISSKAWSAKSEPGSRFSVQSSG